MVAPAVATVTGRCDGVTCGGNLIVGAEVESTTNVIRNLALCDRCGTLFSLTTTLRRATASDREVWAQAIGEV